MLERGITEPTHDGGEYLLCATQTKAMNAMTDSQRLTPVAELAAEVPALRSRF